ncbi:MAG: glycosyltransferase family 4 protein [Thermoleophilaceae bacterium]
MSAAGQPGGALRVALLTPCFWPEVRRGGERLVRDLADGLIARGHHPRLITSHPGRPSKTLEDGLEIVRHWRPPPGRLARRKFEDHLTHLPFTYASLALGHDDVAHAVYVTDAVAAARWSKKSGRPSIHGVIGAPDRQYFVRRRKRVELWVEACRDCDVVTVLSKAAADNLWRDLGVESRVIAPGVDTSVFTPGETPERDERPTIFCASAIDDPMKRVGLLVEAFALVRRERPDARLLLNRPRDTALAGQVTGNDGVELLDAASRSPELIGAYRRSWVCALPSLGEAFGLVLAEALACGTPVVGSNAGGIPEVLGGRDDVGRLFDERTPEALSRALLDGLELAEDDGVRERCRARGEELSLENCVAEYESLYRELIAARARAG